ncbi:MAG: hypothetical protein RLZZ623_654 [Actinomycetota bacterium]|jgi:hypothetical protein
MSRHHTIPRIPRAQLDPVDDSDDALALISLAIHQPLVHETIAIALDARRCGSTITVVSGTDHPDAVLDIVEVMALAACRDMSFDADLTSPADGLVIASVRPEGATLPGDVDRWLEASSLAESFGLRLLEWYVIGPAGPECPRDLIGEPARW